MRNTQRTLRALSLLLSTLIGLGAGFGCQKVYDYEQGTWEVVAEGLPGALFAVYAHTPTDVWAVGANPGDGKGGMVLRYDGEEWRRLSGFALRDIWWLSPGTDGDTLWMSGSKGLILKCSMAEETCEDQSVLGAETLFGIWAVSENEVWAVGGDLSGVGKHHIIWRYDGTGWSQVTALPSDVPETATFFKVWARGSDDVRVIGTAGAALRYDGTTWTTMPTGGEQQLTTIHGNADRTLVVGGFGSGILLKEEGSGYAELDIGDKPVVNGVFVHPLYPPVVAGARGLIMHEQNGAWVTFEDAPDTYFDYHAVTVDSEGGIWAVGGNILVPPLIDGLLVHFKPAVD